MTFGFNKKLYILYGSIYLWCILRTAYIETLKVFILDKAPLRLLPTPFATPNRRCSYKVKFSSVNQMLDTQHKRMLSGS